MQWMTLPTIGVNEDEAKLYWEMPNKSLVQRRQIVAVAETTKIAVDIEAEAEGYLYHLVAHEAVVEQGQPIALIHPSPDVTDEQVQDLLASFTPPAPATESKKWTKKAELLARAKGISITDVPSATEVIKESDVLTYLEQLGSASIPTPDKTAEVKDVVDDVYPTSRPRRLLIVGAGVVAVQVLDVVQRLRHVRAVGLVDDNSDLVDKAVMGVPVLDAVREVERFWERGTFDVAVIAVNNPREFRRRVFEELRARGIPFANVIDPSVVLGTNVQLGQGNIILAHCQIAACSQIGDNNFISAYVSLEHHNQVGSHCQFGPAVFTSGLVTIEDYVKFGTGIYIEPHVRIGRNSVVGSGAVITEHVSANSLIRTKKNYTIAPLEEVDL